MLLGLSAVLLACCATPSDVKQAIKAQSDAYGALDRSLQDFATTYSGLVATIAAADEDSRTRTCALAVVQHVPLDGFNCGEVTSAPPPAGTSRKAGQLAEYSDFTSRLDQAIGPPETPDPTAKSALDASKQAVAGVDGLRRQARALGIINATIADYYGIDLSPGPEATKAAIESLKSLAK
jgi:hypothetical protein